MKISFKKNPTEETEDTKTIAFVHHKGGTGPDDICRDRKGDNRMRRGFSLIELLIVIIVIAILIGIALPRFRSMQDEESITKVAFELRTLQTAVESHYIHRDPHEYPVAEGYQSALLTVAPQIINTRLKDPFDPGNVYSYSLSANGKYYVIWSIGADNVSGVTGVGDTGTISGAPGDDIYVSNATSGTGGF
jgi:general secretion pathway protein G